MDSPYLFLRGIIIDSVLSLALLIAKTIFTHTHTKHVNTHVENGAIITKGHHLAYGLIFYGHNVSIV